MEHSHEVMKHCVIAYLAAMRALDDRLLQCAERYEAASSRVVLTGMSWERRNTRGTHDRGDAVVRLMEVEDEFYQASIRWCEEYMQASLMFSFIESVPRHMLWLKHVERLTWAQVGKRTYYSEKRARTLAAEAIPEAYAIIPEEYKRNAIPNAMPL